MRLIVAAIGVVTILVGCTATKALKVQETAELQGFMGDAYPLLQPGTGEGMAELRYVAEGVDWKQYRATILEPVQFWAGSDSKIPPDAQQMLSTYLYNSLKQNLEKVGVNLVDLPGPGVMRAQIALSDVTKATPVLRTVSVVVPQARVLNQAQELLTGSYGFSGSAEVALKLTDARTGQLLAAAIDRRGGGGGITQAAVWQWGDAKAAIDHWSLQFANRIAELKSKAQAAN
jgi:hypothetical protein